MIILQTILMLIVSNIFMTFAWYGHLKDIKETKWYVAVLLSWGIAFFEYVIMVPANRIGYSQLTLTQLKIIQEVITLALFIPFSIYFMKEPFKTDFIYAGICILGAVYFIFRS